MQRSWKRIKVLCFFIGILQFFFQFSFGSESPEVYFNYSGLSSYTDPYRGIHRPGDNLEAILLREIESAKTSIDIAVQELRLPLVAKALREKSRKDGVRVRVILENTYNHSLKEWMEEQDPEKKKSNTAYGETRMLDYVQLIDQNKDGVLSHVELVENDAIYLLRDTGIPIVDDSFDGSAGSALMHHKFMIVDDQKVVVTSANFTLSDIHGKILDTKTTGNANALIVFENRPMVALFLEEFNMMYGGTGLIRTEPSRFGVKKTYRGVQEVILGRDQKIELQFSPTSKKRSIQETTSGLIQRTLELAKKSIDMALFVFSDQNIADKLYEMKEKNGLRVTAMIDPGFAFRYYSDGLDMLGLQWRAPNCGFIVGNRPWGNAIQEVGAPHMNASDKLHHKFAVMDGTTVIFGSKNWTESANYQNNETVMVIHDARIASAFQREIDYWHTRTRWGVPDHMLEKERQKEKDCGSP